jgi:pimeloyl-ACP methyl ester carboxylesterase
MTRLLDYTTSGSPEKPAMILLHPMGGEKSFWGPFCEAMRDDFFLVAATQYGAGIAPDVTEPISIDRHVQDMEVLRHHLGIDRMIVTGCAIGAMIGARYSALYPGHVAALIMSNPGLRTREAAKQALALRAGNVRAGGMDAVIPAATDAAFFGCPEDAHKAAYVATFRAQNPFNYAATLDSVLDADLTESYRRISSPVLMVPGGNDKLFAVDHGDEIKPLIPQSELLVMPQGAHFIPYQFPQEFAAMIRAFLARHAV